MIQNVAVGPEMTRFFVQGVRADPAEVTRGGMAAVIKGTQAEGISADDQRYDRSLMILN